MNISAPLTEMQTVETLFKMAVLLRQMAIQDAIWLAVVTALKPVEVATGLTYTPTAELLQPPQRQALVRPMGQETLSLEGLY